jgi:TPR repeat protein
LQQLGEFVEAETWYRRAGEAGHVEAMTRLGTEVICRRGDLSVFDTARTPLLKEAS